MRILYTLAAVILCSYATFATVPARVSLHTTTAMKRAVQDSDKDKMVSAYITVDPHRFDTLYLSRLGAYITQDLDNTLCVRMPLSSVEALTNTPGVVYVQVSTSVEKMLDIARPEVDASQVHKGESLPQPYTGKGVVVGIVDSGFQYDHPAFRAADGSLRIKRVWEQCTEPKDGHSAPERFGYGIELIDPEDILKSGGDILNNSHGTHVTSIAAGRDDLDHGQLSGMAPDADIVLVSMLEAGGGNVNISDAIAYIFDYADEAKAPCVVNLSLGSHKGPHDGTSTFDVIADRLQGPGRLIVGASGNHRADPFHINAVFESNESAPLRTFLDFKKYYSQTNGEGEVEIWAPAEAEVEVAVLLFKSTSKEVTERVVIYPSDSENTSVDLGRNITGELDAYTETSPLNGKKHILLSSKITNIRTGYYLGLEVKPLSTGSVDIWADCFNIVLSSKGIDGFSDPGFSSSICEIGGTAHRILTVGAYTTRSTFTRFGDTAESSLAETVGDLGSFSSCGPTVDGRIKPQVTAPGCFISSAVSTNDHSGTLILSNVLNDGTRDYYYGYMQGTSMAAPMVTGIVASWLEAYPELTPEQLAEVVKLTSRKDSYTGPLTDGDNCWGYGKIDALSGIKQCVALSGSGSIGSVISDSTPYRAYTSADGISLIFSQDIDSATIELYDTMGALTFSRRIARITAGTIITLPRVSAASLSILRITTPTHTSAQKIRL